LHNSAGTTTPKSEGRDTPNPRDWPLWATPITAFLRHCWYY